MQDVRSIHSRAQMMNERGQAVLKDAAGFIDKDGFSYRDLLQQFQGQTQSNAKKKEQETPAKSKQSAPIKETSATEMLNHLSRMSNSYRVSSKTAPRNENKNEPIKGDLNSDGVIDDADEKLMRDCVKQNYLKKGTSYLKAADFDDDGEVNIADMSEFRQAMSRFKESQREISESSTGTRNRLALTNTDSAFPEFTVVPSPFANIILGPTGNDRREVLPVPQPNPGPPSPIPPSPTPNPIPAPPDNDKNALSFSAEDLESVKKHIVELEMITDPAALAKYDFDGNGKISLVDLARMDRLVSSDTNGDGVFDETDAAALRERSDKADILAMWDKINELYAGKIKEIEREKQNDEWEKESEEIKNDLKDIDWYEPVLTPKLEPIVFDKTKGDVNGDGKINDDDLDMIRKYIIGTIYLNKYKNDTYSEYVKPEYTSVMDVNEDGIVDEVDFSIAVNLANGKEIHNVPGSSEDNPLYLVTKSEQLHIPKGEFVKLDKESKTFYIDENGKWHINADNDKSSDKKKIYTNDDDVFVESGDYSQIKIEGANSIINVNYDKNSAVNYSDFFGNNSKIITATGSNSTIIRDKGGDKDVFVFDTGGHGDYEIQNNDDSAFTIRIADYITINDSKCRISLKEINGIPTIVNIDGESLVLLKGKINGETIVMGYGGSGGYTWNNEQIKLSELPGADEIFSHTSDTDNFQWVSRTYTRKVQDGGEDFVEKVGNINSTFTVSDGNEVTISESNDELKEVIPNLITYNGTVDVTKGDIKLKVDDKEYVKANGAATYTRDWDKLKVEAKEPIELETLEDSTNVEIRASNGDNTITLNGKNGKVFTGNGNDKIVINGDDSAVFLEGGENDITINAWSYVQAGQGKDIFSIKASGGKINGFDPNMDTLNLSLSLGKLTVKQVENTTYPTILLQNAETGMTVCALSNYKDLDKIQEIVKTHNESWELNEAENHMAVLQHELAEHLGRLVNEAISENQSVKEKEDAVKRLLSNIKVSPSDADVSEADKRDFAEAIADYLSEQSDETSIKNMEKFLGSIIDGLTPFTTKNGMRVSGGTYNGAYAFSATPKNKASTTMYISSNDKENKAAVADFMKAMAKEAKDLVDDATKKFISAITSISEKKVSAGYDIGMALLDVMSGKKPDAGKVGKALLGLSEAVIFSFVNNAIHKAAEKKSFGGNLDMFGGTLWEEDYIEKVSDFRNAKDLLIDTKKQYNNLTKTFVESDKKTLDEQLKTMQGYVNYLIQL